MAIGTSFISWGSVYSRITGSRHNRDIDKGHTRPPPGIGASILATEKRDCIRVCLNIYS